VSRHEVKALVAEGALVPALRGVYIPTPLAVDIAARAAAVALALPPGAAICRRTAAWLHGVDARLPGEHTQPPPLECLVPLGTTPPRRPGIAAYSSALHADDVSMISGVPATSPSRTAIDLARSSPRFIGLSTLDAFAHAEMISVPQIVAALDRLRGERFVAKARTLIELCEPKTESAGESWLRLRLVDAGLPRPKVQVSLRRDDGSEQFRLDSGYEEHLVAAEFDGLAFHGMTQAQQAADVRRRETILRSYGWTALGFTTENVLAARPAAEVVVAELIGWSRPLRRRTW
jgi:very-short-patch-repair endonuclease